MIKVGQILTTHGYKGEVKVLPLTDDPKRFEKLEHVFLKMSHGYEKVHIDTVKYHKNAIILKLHEIKDMNCAENLRQVYICIEKKQLMDLPPDHFYIFDILSLDVFEGEVFLGKVQNVIQTGSNDVFVVKNNGKEILIPALKSVVKKVDFANNKILVDLPEGLLD